MTNLNFSKDDFKRLIETYGSDIDRWPAAFQDPARAMMNSDATFTKPLMAEAVKLDEALASARLTPGTDMLKARILNGLESQPSRGMDQIANDRAARGMKYHTVAAMMVMSFVLGFAGSNFLQPNPAETGSSVFVENDWEELANEYGMSDVYEWVGLDTTL